MNAVTSERTKMQTAPFTSGNVPGGALTSDMCAEPELDRKARFAQRVSVSVRCVDNWIHDRRIPFLKIGRTVLIPWREALETLNRNYRLNARTDRDAQR